MNPKDTHCSHCGAAFTVATYPKTCAACGATTWANPIPVAVLLVPVRAGGRDGLLVVRRAIPPIGKLALPGGFAEAHETWQAAAARELREEAGVEVDAAAVTPVSFASSHPRPDRVLLFGLAPAVDAAQLAPFTPSPESQARAAVFGPGDLEAVFAFPLHLDAARRYFAERGVTGAHDVTEV